MNNVRFVCGRGGGEGVCPARRHVHHSTRPSWLTAALGQNNIVLTLFHLKLWLKHFCNIETEAKQTSFCTECFCLNKAASSSADRQTYKLCKNFVCVGTQRILANFCAYVGCVAAGAMEVMVCVCVCVCVCTHVLVVHVLEHVCVCVLTFSWCMCFSRRISLYVRLACTAVWKGRASFFSATFSCRIASNDELQENTDTASCFGAFGLQTRVLLSVEAARVSK